MCIQQFVYIVQISLYTMRHQTASQVESLQYMEDLTTKQIITACVNITLTTIITITTLT